MIKNKLENTFEVPHEGNKLTFKYPSFKGNYGNVANAIDNEKLKRPNSSETASLVYDAFQNKKGEYESQIIEILNNAWLWEYTGNLYLPKKSDEEISNGVILDLNSQNLKFENGKLIMDKSSLIKRLKENDSSVKFVPFGFKTGEQTPKELEKNDYIVARYGEEGAEKMAKIASKYRKNPYIYSFDSVNEEKARISALCWNWLGDDRLYVSGGDWGGKDDSHAFGIVPEKTGDKK